jgi:hypothetical protein
VAKSSTQVKGANQSLSRLDRPKYYWFYDAHYARSIFRERISGGQQQSFRCAAKSRLLRKSVQLGLPSVVKSVLMCEINGLPFDPDAADRIVATCYR